MSELFEVSEGKVYRDEESGDELTVTKVYAARGYAVLEDTDGNERTMRIERLLDAIEEGELVRVEDEAEEEETDADEAVKDEEEDEED